MRERAAELGGACTISVPDGGGTRVSVLPSAWLQGSRRERRAGAGRRRPPDVPRRPAHDARRPPTTSSSWPRRADGEEALGSRRSTSRRGPARRQHAGLSRDRGRRAGSPAGLPEVAVLMLTMFADDASVFAALRAGARGYVLKDAGRDDLLRAIRAVATGRGHLQPVDRARGCWTSSRGGTRRSRPRTFPMLTSRERDVLHLIAAGPVQPGRSPPGWACTRKTTSNYVSAILTKLQVRNRAEAAERARSQQRGSRVVVSATSAAVERCAASRRYDASRDAVDGLGEAALRENRISLADGPHRVASGMSEGEGGAVGASVVSSARSA